jgi:EAL domain-containing protein (putative c-di-GMP-specific phosphodiesterase class I)
MVETAEEAAILRREGVKFLQGYYFGKPSLEKPWLAPAPKIPVVVHSITR